MTRDEYVRIINKEQNNIATKIYSEPIYICPVCGGKVRKNYNTCMVLTSNPPQIMYRYDCNACDYQEYL